MAKEKKNTEEFNAELYGMGLYGTTANIEVEGYNMSGDIENAGHLDKGYKKDKEHMGAQASVENSDSEE
ncbi:hypothetical protein [Tuberibacillus sp. Marseille-P3662]|uniref:hypothetical protein n=1 Tax=Tuberibacillus sp. Marseille-P3662 TaxID=1965358 RepID=UPI000A1CCEC2|nr:hypothetical protein [Tuberibacillus sp. Marseille-P3662]